MDFSDAKSVQQSLPGQLADKQINSLKKNAVSASEGNDSEKMKTLSKQFESIMTHQLLSAMRNTVPKSELSGSFSSDMYQSMMDQEIANQSSKGKGLGLADMVYRQVSRLDAKEKAARLPATAILPTRPPANAGLPIDRGTDGFPLRRSETNISISSNSAGTTGSIINAAKAYGRNQ